MLTIRKILHPTDFTASSEGAFRQAVELARRFGAALHVLHILPHIGADTFFDLTEGPGGEPSEVARWEHIAEQMEQRLRPLRGDVPIHRAGGYGMLTGPAIISYVREADIDLVVLGACGRGGGRDAHLGIATREVLHRVPCPVMTVSGEKVANQAVRMEHVLAPVDPAEPVTAELRYANDLALTYDARLSLLHVLDPKQDSAATEEMLPHLQEAARTHLQEHFARALQRLCALGLSEGSDEDVDIHVRVGSPGDEILRFIGDQDVDLVVISMHKPIGAHVGTGADLVEFVAAHAPCPVLSINHLGKSRIEVAEKLAPMQEAPAWMS